MTKEPCNCKTPKNLDELNEMMKPKTVRKRDKRRILWLFLKYQWQTTWSAAKSFILYGVFMPKISEKLNREIEEVFSNGKEFQN